MKRLFECFAAALLPAGLGGPPGGRYEPPPPGGGRPWVPPAESGADSPADPVPPQECPDDGFQDRLAAELASRVSWELYYADYMVYALLDGEPPAEFEGVPLRYVAGARYRGSDAWLTWPAARYDRWDLFLGTRSAVRDLAGLVAGLEEEASLRKLFPEEEALLESSRRDLAAEESAALGEMEAALWVEAAGRRLPVRVVEAGALEGALPPPAWFPAP